MDQRLPQPLQQLGSLGCSAARSLSLWRGSGEQRLQRHGPGASSGLNYSAGFVSNGNRCYGRLGLVPPPQQQQPLLRLAAASALASASCSGVRSSASSAAAAPERVLEQRQQQQRPASATTCSFLGSVTQPVVLTTEPSVSKNVVHKIIKANSARATTTSPSGPSPVVNLENLLLPSKLPGNSLLLLFNADPFRIIGGHTTLNSPSKNIKLVAHLYFR